MVVVFHGGNDVTVFAISGDTAPSGGEEQSDNNVAIFREANADWKPIVRGHDFFGDDVTVKPGVYQTLVFPICEDEIVFRTGGETTNLYLDL